MVSGTTETAATSRILSGDEAFEADQVPTVLMDRNLVIRAVNPAFSRTMGRPADALLSLDAFEAFPDNPDHPEADGVARMGVSLERVFSSGIPDNMIIQRYDIADPLSGKFLQKHWAPINSPVFHEGRVIGVQQRVKDVTVLRADALEVMERYRDIMNSRTMRSQDAEDHQAMINAFTDGMNEYTNLQAEVAQLREALSSRGTIEQAKGMLMVSRRCSPDEAFNILRELSQSTNVRLVDVAAALIYQMQAGN